MSNVRITPFQQVCLVGLANNLTWHEIGLRTRSSKSRIARSIAAVRVALGEDVSGNTLIERNSLIGKAQAAGLIQPGMKLSNSGYIVFGVTQHSKIDPAFYRAKPWYGPEGAKVSE